MIEYAKKMFSQGIMTMPLNSVKVPVTSGPWKHLKDDTVTWDMIEKLNWKKAQGIGYICGKNSGNLFCIDIDMKHDPDKKIATKYKEALNRIEPKWMKQLVSQTTMSGGFHFVGKCEIPVETLKLARGPKEAMLETRGQGGYFAGYPTPKYNLLRGSFETLHTFSAEEVDMMFHLGKELDPHPAIEFTPPPTLTYSDCLKPGTDYNNKTTSEQFLAEILSDGYKQMRVSGQKIYLCRPGKNRGTSATFNSPETPGKLYIFSSSTELPERTGMTPFSYLTHKQFNGDFKECARYLGQQGYGEQKEYKKHEKPQQQKQVPTIKTVDSSFEEMLDLYHNGHKLGLSTGWKQLDVHYQIVKGHMTIVTGYPSHGKSEMMDALMINTAKIHNWKWLIYSPENHPITMHKEKLAEKIIGKPFRKSLSSERMTEAELKTAHDFIEKHFVFMDGNDDADITIESIFDLVDKIKPDALILDPFNEMSIGRSKDESETDFIGKSLRSCRKFARSRKIAFYIVAHPMKPTKDKVSGKYPRPDAYSIHGSAHWRNKSDFVLVVHRENDWVEFEVNRVRFKTYGSEGSIKMDYDVGTGVYKAYIPKLKATNKAIQNWSN